MGEKDERWGGGERGSRSEKNGGKKSKQERSFVFLTSIYPGMISLSLHVLFRSDTTPHINAAKHVRTWHPPSATTAHRCLLSNFQGGGGICASLKGVSLTDVATNHDLTRLKCAKRIIWGLSLNQIQYLLQSLLHSSVEIPIIQMFIPNKCFKMHQLL